MQVVVGCSWGNVVMVALTTQTSSSENKASIGRFAPKIGPLAIPASAVTLQFFFMLFASCVVLRGGHWTGQSMD
jgi:hypothetical protein